MPKTKPSIINRETHTIDVRDKVLGRIAVDIALLLRGKGKPEFALNKDIGDIVVIKNIKEIKVTGKKADNKIYYRHSGYLGGLTATPYKKLFEKDPKQVLVKAVFGMLPKNKLRARQIKRLKFE
jgi:large subunit ribosomal protein L13